MIEFLPEEHIYLYRGVIVPSVTSILKATLFKDKYKNVPAYILNNKATFGNNVHKAIELDTDNDLSLVERVSYNEWKKLQARYKVAPIEQETLVHYDDLYCGTLDMVAIVNDEVVINDIKTTAVLDKEYLSWQLSFYKYAYEDMGGQELVKAYATWLPKKELGEFVEIEFKTKEEVLQLVEEYERLNENGET